MAGDITSVRRTKTLGLLCSWRGLRVVALAMGAVACGSTLMKQRVETTGHEWHLAVREVQNGPNSMAVQNFNYKPGSDERFLHVWVTLRNLSTQQRKWNWPRCGLDHGDKEYLPSLVLLDMIVNSPAEEVQDLDAGEEIERRVIFTYPEEGPLPTRLKCGELVIPLDLKP